MVVDTSALVAILLAEPDAKLFTDAISVSPSVSLSAGNYVELAIVVDNRGGPSARRELETLLRSGGITVVSVTPEQAVIARDAHVAYGRGNHPARLNFGDCFAYALAKDLGEPLLFKGDDFAQTDIEPAI
ncbi:MAG: type II toxin-antitoxin system VapC family toxin [Alphaproteobacteria bacterium]